MKAPVPDLYSLFHKALRLGLTDLMNRMAVTDAQDREGWARIEDEGLVLQGILLKHSAHEEHFLHPMILAAAPQVAAKLDADHERLDDGVRRLGAALAGLGAVTDAAERADAAQVIYRELSAFIADYFQHLLVEETEAMPALNRHFPPDVMMQTHRDLVASIPPEEKLAELPLIARAWTPAERIMLMAMTRAAAPRPFFDAARKVMADAIGPEAWAVVAAGLEPAVVLS
mgnify:CR=1 FL=1